MTGRAGLGRAFADEWSAVSKQVVRPAADAERDWRAAVGLRTADEPPLPASLAVFESPDAPGEVRA